jgi:Transposase DDE domain group 1
VRGYHPILAVRADTGEVLHIRLRKGSANSSRGFGRLLDELLARVDRAGAAGSKLLRADSGFWNNHTFQRLDRAGWQFSIGVRLQPAVRAAIDTIDETAWQTLPDYPKTSIAQIAETTLNDRRLVVRRVRTLDRQGELLPSWELFPFITNRTDDLKIVEAEHRQHAVVELAIRDLKDQALAHFPSGRFYANAAWTVIAALAHNLLRWTSLIGLPGHTIRAARTLRRRLLALPGRLTRSGRRWTLHLPARWPWQHDFIRALARIRALPAAA